MVYDHVRGIRDPLNLNLALEFCRNQNQLINVLTKTHISFDQIHYMRNNCLGSIFSSPGDRKGLLVLLHLGLEVITERDTDTKGMFGFFKVFSI